MDTPPASDSPVSAIVTQPDGTEKVETDVLLNMFYRQLGHIEEYNKIYAAKGLDLVAPSQWGNLNNPAVQAAIRETAGYVIEEMYEAIGLLKNKKWKQTPKETDADAFYKELGDAWHFWLELMIFAGMTPDKIVSNYFNMAKKNDERRETGY